MKARTFLVTGAIVSTSLGLSACHTGSGTSASQNSVSTTSIAGQTTGSPGQAATVARQVCKTYDAAIDAHPDGSDYSSLFTATGEAEDAARFDTRWQNLATAFDQIKTDITQINGLQTPGERANPAMLQEDQALLAGHLAGIDALCFPLTGSHHLPAGVANP
jgi:hypothetical protein